MNNILEVRNLMKSYNSFTLKNISFEIPRGYVMGFIGANGAGKTTTIKSILNMINFDSGNIEIFGLDNIKSSMEIKDRIGVVMDLPFYVSEWTAKDVEKAVSPFYTKWNPSEYSRLLEYFKIDKNKQVKELSRGMKLKLMLTAALSHGAELLILDEPTSGLDPLARDELMDTFREFMSETDRGILFSTHITSDLEKIADYITFIENGEIIFTGLNDTLMETYSLIKGGLHDIDEAHKKYIIGFREYDNGFEGMVKTSDVKVFSKNVLTEPASLEEIIIYMNKRGVTNV